MTLLLLLLRDAQAHREANDGAWPETVAVNLWGLDSIKTKGESGEQGPAVHAVVMLPILLRMCSAR